MKLNQACILLSASLLPLIPLLLGAADDTVSGSSAPMTASQTAHAEALSRRELNMSANQAISDGQRFLGSGNYDDAAKRFQYALDALPPGGISTPSYRRAEAGLAAAKAGQAQQAAKDYKFAQAASLLQEAVILEPDNPVYAADIEDLKKQQMAYEEQVRDPEGTVNNPAVTPEFKDRVAAAQKLLFQGDAYFRTGQFDRAEDTYSKILLLDPYNKAARDKMSHIERYKERAEGFRHEEYEQAAMEKVNHGWAEDISPDIVTPPTQTGPTTTTSNRANITHKLQSIIIDKVNFEKLDIAAVIQFLQQKSKELDPDHEGVNFVLRLNTDTTPPVDTTTPPAAAAPAGPATTDASGATATTATDATGAAAATAGTTPPATGATPDATATPGATATTTTAPAVIPNIHREVSITLENVPLSEILSYIISQTNLQYTVEDYAVYLRPSIDEGETLSVRTYLVPPNFFSGSTLSVTLTAPTDAAPTRIQDVGIQVQQQLTDKGIRFPTGATATFLPGSSKLVVRDTPEQLDLIANLIDQLSQETPQVEIEAKVAEFTEDAIKALTFNYQIGTSGSPNAFIKGISGGVGGATSLRTVENATGLGSTIPVTGPGGLTPDGIDQLIQGNSESSSSFPLTGITPVNENTPNTLTIGAVIDNIGLAAFVTAINNLQGVSLLSAPSVTTQNGLKANIDIVREFPYPTSFERPRLSNNSNIAYSSGPGANLPLLLAIPPTPREFVTQDVGVSLEVKPTTYPDQRIDLDITKAQVLDFDGFVNYGVPIEAVENATFGAVPLTPGTINQPVFNLRSVVTNLQVLDGQTAVLGGLIREDTQEIDDKVPVLGDIPLVGRLFQSKVTSRIKKSLLLFVTARLIRSNGKPEYINTLNAEPEEEILPEPDLQIGPGVTLPPLPEGTPNS